ncbi:MAG: hypothetical protein IKJ01_01110 [Lachnospiraceae bacterium]|nr:hypothetical protein [Lachnospiraceae bacterium]
MNIVYFGTDVFLDTFCYIANTHNIIALYTYHNDEDYFTEYEIVKEAKKRNIPIYYEAISVAKIREYFLEQNCDLFFSAEYNRIIPILEDLLCYKGVNIHSSFLPIGRSYYPIECAMERNMTRTGVTIHKMVAELDVGAVLLQKEIEIMPYMDSVDIYLQCGMYARQMTEVLLSDFEQIWNHAIPQTEKCSYWKRTNREKLTITHEMTIKETYDIYRRYNHMTEVVIDEKRYYVSSIMTSRIPIFKQEWFLSQNRCLYQVKDGHLRLNLLEII